MDKNDRGHLNPFSTKKFVKEASRRYTCQKKKAMKKITAKSSRKFTTMKIMKKASLHDSVC